MPKKRAPRAPSSWLRTASRLIAVDPGVHFCGVAWFLDRKLVHAEYRPSGLVLPAGTPAEELFGVGELPQVYKGGKADPGDLVNLTLALGRMTANILWQNMRYRRPCVWKKQTPKKIQHDRMLKVLDADEKRVLANVKCDPDLLHNVNDGVCLGLVELGRLGS